MQPDFVVKLKLTASISISHTEHNVAWKTSLLTSIGAICDYVCYWAAAVAACVFTKCQSIRLVGFVPIRCVLTYMPAMANLTAQLLDFYINREHKLINFMADLSFAQLPLSSYDLDVPLACTNLCKQSFQSLLAATAGTACMEGGG